MIALYALAIDVSSQLITGVTNKLKQSAPAIS